MGKGKDQFKSGVVLSYVNLLVGNLIPFIYTPIMLNILGQAEYGLYTLAHTVVGYLSLLSFGMGSAVVRYITKYRTLGDKKKAQQMFGLFTFLYSVLAVLVLILGIVLALNIEVFYGNTLSDAEISKMRILVILCTINSALTFVFTTYSSIILVYEKYIFRQILSFLTTVLSPCLNIAVLLIGLGSVGMVMSATAITVFAFIMNIIYCSHTLHIYPIFRGMPFGEIKDIFMFCFFNFLGSVVDMLFWATDKVIIGAAIGTVAVAVYNIGATFNGFVTSFSTTLSGVLAPKITNMIFKNADKSELTNIFIKIGRLQFIVVAFVVSGFIVFGRQFITLWAGTGYSESYMIALLTLLPVIIPLIQNTGLAIVLAQNKHKFRSTVYLIIAVANAVSTYFAVWYWGIIGAAVCSAVSYIIGQGFIMNWYYWRKTGIDIPLFWKNILKMLPVTLIMTALGLFVTEYILLNNWVIFFVMVAAYSALYIPLIWFCGMNEYEKNLIKSPMMKILNLVRRK